MAEGKAHVLKVRNTTAQNKKVLEREMRSTDNMKALRESVRGTFGLDILDPKAFPVSDPGFSLGLLKKKIVREAAAGRLRETAVSSGFPQLLRAGVQVAFNSLVETYTDTTYEKWAHVMPSKMDTELYAPLHGISFLAERGPTEAFAETSIKALDLKLKNKEFGQILSIDQNLLDDDSTGQLSQLSGDLAEWTKLLFEVYCYGKLASVAGANYAGVSIPLSETKPSYEANYPFTVTGAPFVGGGFNASAPAALTQAQIVLGTNTMLQQKNLLGLKMVVKPKLLTISPLYQFDAAVLMRSTLNPSVPSATAGAAQGAYGINPLQALLDINVSRYVFDNTGNANGNSSAYYIMDDTKPWFVLQLRDPGSVIMENPESGQSFERKVQRHRLDVRANADYIEPRFVWRGSDGSV